MSVVKWEEKLLSQNKIGILSFTVYISQPNIEGSR